VKEGLQKRDLSDALHGGCQEIGSRQQQRLRYGCARGRVWISRTDGLSQGCAKFEALQIEGKRAAARELRQVAHVISVLLDPPYPPASHCAPLLFITTVVGICFSSRTKQVTSSDMVNRVYRDRMTAFQYVLTRLVGHM
jgi:hypothetical protein